MLFKNAPWNSILWDDLNNSQKLNRNCVIVTTKVQNFVFIHTGAAAQGKCGGKSEMHRKYIYI